MRIDINCKDVDDAISILESLKKDIDKGEEYLECKPGEIVFIDFGLVDFD